MKLRLSKLLSTNPENWLKMQQTLEIWDRERHGTYAKIKAIKPPIVTSPGARLPESDKVDV